MKPASFDTAEWIDAWRDRRPMTDDPVLVTRWCRWTKCYVVTIETYDGGGWSSDTVIAWMPLPETYDPVAAYEADKRYEQIVFKKDESGKVVSVEW